MLYHFLPNLKIIGSSFDTIDSLNYLSKMEDIIDDE